jgi:protein tyrosine phosphatase
MILQLQSTSNHFKPLQKPLQTTSDHFKQDVWGNKGSIIIYISLISAPSAVVMLMLLALLWF